MKYSSVLIFLFFCATGVCGQIEKGKTVQNSVAEDAVYIPADQRHRGLSRYDLIPFTDRKRGDIDRYRAVNPNFVKRENGRYFYALTVNKDAPVYDENLIAKGTLGATDVEIDLTDTKTTADKISYVFVKNKGYIRASAVEQTAQQIRRGKWFYFPLKSGAHKLFDGTGIERGTLIADSVKLNYGLQKEIGGEIFYYAFATQMKLKTGEQTGASGWIKQSAIAAGNDPRFDPSFVAKMQMPTASDDKFTAYEITGGEPQAKNSAGVFKFGFQDKNGNFIAYKVLPKIPLDGRQSVAVTDYLKRGDEVVNLGFNPAGVSNDTFRVGGRNRPLIFYRSAEKDATAAIDLFYPKDAAHSGEEIAAKMIFVYGYVAAGNNKRWGWIPLDALRLAGNK